MIAGNLTHPGSETVVLVVTDAATDRVVFQQRVPCWMISRVQGAVDFVEMTHHATHFVTIEYLKRVKKPGEFGNAIAMGEFDLSSETYAVAGVAMIDLSKGYLWNFRYE